MPMKLSGSCKCGAVSFTLQSHDPYPYLRCYCSICRKTTGGGGYAIGVNGIFSTLKIEGAESIGGFHATLIDKDGNPFESPVERQFCTRCHSALFSRGPDWGDVVLVAASAVDTDLPDPPIISHMMLGSKANWVQPQIGPNDETFDEFPDKTVEEWHRAQGVWVE